jgi:hypothetical protein
MRLGRTAGTVGLACLALLAFGGCGESEQAKAEKTVCGAKANITSNVQSLQALTPQTISASKVQSSLSAITDELQKIKQAEGQLTSTRKGQVEKANSEFAASLSTLTHELTSLNLANLQAQLTAAVSKLAAGYRQAFTPVQC